MLDYDWKNQKREVVKIKVEDLLEQLKIQIQLTEKDNSLYTIHEAKGQEAECILVLAENKNQLNEWLAVNNSSEESRVGYVAFSRARKLLCVWAPGLIENDYKFLEENVDFIDLKSIDQEIAILID